MMTQGGPQFSTVTLVYLIYDTAFKQFVRLASAQAVVLFAIVFTLAIVQFKLLGQEVEIDAVATQGEGMGRCGDTRS